MYLKKIWEYSFRLESKMKKIPMINLITRRMLYKIEAYIIKKYGLFDYSYFKDKIPYEFYEAFNGKYLRVALGKGILTEDMIDYYINRYLPVVNKQNI